MRAKATQCFLLVAGAGYYGENNPNRWWSPLLTIRQSEHSTVSLLNDTRRWPASTVTKQEIKAKKEIHWKVMRWKKSNITWRARRMVNQGRGIQLLHLLRSYLHRDDPFEQRSLSGVRVKADLPSRPVRRFNLSVADSQGGGPHTLCPRCKLPLWAVNTLYSVPSMTFCRPEKTFLR